MIIASWLPTPEVGIDGSRWRVGAMIVVPPLALGPPLQEAGVGRVAFYPRPELEHELFVIVLIGAVGAPECTLNPPFDSGHRVPVTVAVGDVTSGCVKVHA